MYNATHHANEWITSLLLMKFIEQYAKPMPMATTLQQALLLKHRLIYCNYSTIHFVPMVNPDGAVWSQEESFKHELCNCEH